MKQNPKIGRRPGANFYFCSILFLCLFYFGFNFFLFYFYFFLFNFYLEISGRALRQEIYLRQTGPEQKYKQNSEKIEIKQEENRNKIGKNRNNIGQKQKVALSTGSLLVPFSSYFLRILHPILILFFWYLLILSIIQTQIGIQPHKPSAQLYDHRLCIHDCLCIGVPETQCLFSLMHWVLNVVIGYR